MRVTPPHSVTSCNAATDDVEGPNGECPEVSFFKSKVVEYFFKKSKLRRIDPVRIIFFVKSFEI